VTYSYIETVHTRLNTLFDNLIALARKLLNMELPEVARTISKKLRASPRQFIIGQLAANDMPSKPLIKQPIRVEYGLVNREILAMLCMAKYDGAG